MVVSKKDKRPNAIEIFALLIEGRLAASKISVLVQPDFSENVYLTMVRIVQV